MSGHISEKRWARNTSRTTGGSVSDQVTEVAIALTDILHRAERLSLEIEELLDYVDGDDKIQAVADQLFYDDWHRRESDPISNPGVLDRQANAAEVKKVEDAINAVKAGREIFDFANDGTDGKSRLAKLRRML